MLWTLAETNLPESRHTRPNFFSCTSNFSHEYDLIILATAVDKTGKKLNCQPWKLWECHGFISGFLKVLQSDRVKVRSENKHQALKPISKDPFVKTAHSLMFVLISSLLCFGKGTDCWNNLHVKTTFFFVKCLFTHTANSLNLVDVPQET